MHSIHKRTIDRIKRWAKAHPVLSKVVLVIVATLVVGLIVLLSLILSARPATAPVSKVVEEPEPVIYYSPLTGVEVAKESTTKAVVTGIMIENSPEARPQSGLKQAGVVYEAVAEGGITRFLALYQEDKPKLIGPVRSLRTGFVDWVAPFDASVAHIGGSARALQIIRNGTYRDIDQFFNPAYYWRATDRWAPHNVYTSFDKLNALNKAKGYKTSKFKSWPRIDGEPGEKRNATKINVTVSGTLFNSAYVYDKKMNKYKRSQGGAAHVDREKGRITPSVVIVLHTTQTASSEDGYRENYKTTGTGKALIFQGGKVTKANWKKTSRNSQLQFLDSENEPMELFRGQTWITAIGTNRGGKVTWD